MASTRWNASVAVADSREFDAGESTFARVEKIRRPTVCVRCESVKKEAKRDTIRVHIRGSVGTYCVKERTFDDSGSLLVDIPQAPEAGIESENGGTYSAEIRTRP